MRRPFSSCACALAIVLLAVAAFLSPAAAQNVTVFEGARLITDGSVIDSSAFIMAAREQMPRRRSTRSEFTSSCEPPTTSSTTWSTSDGTIDKSTRTS